MRMEGWPSSRTRGDWAAIEARVTPWLANSRDADKAVLELLRDVYQGQHPAHKTVLLKDLFDLLEKVIDRCRDAGNVVTHIVLKNS